MQKSTENISEPLPRGFSRREVLRTAAASLVLLLPLAAQADAAEQWASIGKADDFVKDQPKKIALNDGTVLYVTRQTADILVAVSAKCTHRGCEVGWQADDTQFHCPCHGAVFAVAGTNVRGTRRSPDEALPNLPSLPTRQKDGQIQVNLGAVAADQLKPVQG